VDGSKRRLCVLLLGLGMAACDPMTIAPATPTVGPTQAPTQSGPPSATASASAPTSTPIGSAPPPTSVRLPLGFDAIPWANLPAGDGNEDSFTVSIGVLGKPATTTRTFNQQPDISADGSAVLLSTGPETAIVDATTGTTIATFDHRALELDRVPKNNLSYSLFNWRFRADVAHGYLYLLSANRDGVQLRRFALDGSGETRLAVIAPDPGRQLWYADLVLTSAGQVVATACPFETEQLADARCRLYEAEPGAIGPLKPRFLPRKAARPCSLIAASEKWLIGSNDQSCRADGGPPQFVSYMALDRETLRTSTVTAPSGLLQFGVEDNTEEPRLVANVHTTTYPHPLLFPPAAVVVRLNDPLFTVEPIVPEDVGGDGSTTYERYIWSVAGRGAGWTLFHGYSPAYVACAVEAVDDDTSRCPSGPVFLDTTEGTFELPEGTWGGVVPPLGFLGL